MSQKVSKEIVAKMADLSRLHLEDAELEAATQNLEGIFEHFAAIQGTNTEGVPTADDASGLTNVTREDEARPEVLSTHEQLMKNAPATKQGQIQVQSVFKD